MRTTAGVAIPLVIALLAGSPASGAAAATGAMCVGFASQQGVYRTRAAAMLWTASAMALSTFVGGLCSHALPALVLVTALWGFGCGLIASLGGAATAVGINSVIALVVFGHFQLPLPAVVAESVLVLAGGLGQTFLLVIVWPLRRFSVERHTLAGAFRSLAAYARNLTGGALELPSAKPLTTVRETLADPQPFARRGDIGAFQALLDEAERIRGSLASLVAERALMREPEAIDDLSRAAAGLLEGIASALDAGREPVDGAGDWKSLAQAQARLDAIGTSEALAGQIRSAWRTATFPAGEHGQADRRSAKRPTSSFPSLEDTLATLRANLPLSSPYGRLAIRLCVTLAVAALLGGILPTQHGYWIAMTTVILLKPDFTTTFVRGIGRVVGTLIGAFVATAVAAHVRPGPETYVLLCILFAAGGYSVFNANYGLFTIAITSYVAFALSLLGQPEATAVADRVFATLTAAVLAGVAVLVWPTWEAARVRAALAALLDAQRRYLRRVLDAYVEPGRYDARAVATAQSTAWAARADAEASVDRMLGEPSRTHGIEPDRALGILAASRRIALAALSLSAHYAHALRIARPALQRLADDFDDALRSVRDALAEGTPPAPYPPLRAAHGEAAKSLSAGSDPDAEMLLFETDALVDGANTLAELLR